MYLPDPPYVFTSLDELKTFAYFGKAVSYLRGRADVVRSGNRVKVLFREPLPILGNAVFDLLLRYRIEDILRATAYLQCAIKLCAAKGIKKRGLSLFDLPPIVYLCRYCEIEDLVEIYERMFFRIPPNLLLELKSAFCKIKEEELRIMDLEVNKYADALRVNKVPEECKSAWAEHLLKVAEGSEDVYLNAVAELNGLFITYDYYMWPIPAPCKYRKTKERARVEGDVVYYYARSWYRAVLIWVIFDASRVDIAPRWECGGGFRVVLEGESARRFAVGMRNLYRYLRQAELERYMGRRFCIDGFGSGCFKSILFTGSKGDIKYLRMLNPTWRKIEKMVKLVRELEPLEEPPPEFVVSEHVLQYLHFIGLKFAAKGLYVYPWGDGAHLLAVIEKGRPEIPSDRWVFIKKPP